MLSEAIYKIRYLLVIAFSDLVTPKGAVLFVCGFRDQPSDSLCSW